MTKPQIIGGALVWRSGFSVDADGAPCAYAPPPLVGLDYLANAGHEGRWWGLACNPQGVPYVQPSGFYISVTALVDHSKPVSDPARYVDASTVPYVSIARDLLPRGIKMGDVAWVSYHGKSCGAVCADVSPSGSYGEGSIALANALDIPSSPKHGGCADGVTWIVFPGSSAGWPRTVADVQAQAERLYDAWGGDARAAQAFAVV